MSNSEQATDAYRDALKKAVIEVDTAVTVKDLERAVCREASLRASLNSDTVPNLLYAPISVAFDHMLRRLRELGWQQAVPLEELGLRIGDCAVLADLLHVLYLPLRNDSIPMPQADHKIALDAARRLAAALSNLDGAQLENLRRERSLHQEQRSDAFAKDHSQVYIIAFHDPRRTQLRVKLAWSYQFDDYDLASRRTFITQASARTYAQELCVAFNKTLHEPTPDHAFLD